MSPTGIEWTDETWNPITGCSKVSPGCAHCYAETLALTRMRGRPGYPGLPWTPENAAENVTLRPERLDQPLRWRRPRRIFVNSLSDVFHELVPDEFIDRVFAIMAAAPRHTFQVLTKRPARMRAYLTGRRAEHAIAHRARTEHGQLAIEWPLPNVWVGTSVENQHWADIRIPELLATPAAVRFLSMEPLLGPVDLHRWLAGGLKGTDNPHACPTCSGTGIVGFGLGTKRCPQLCRRPWKEPRSGLDWIIVGGESGPVHRPIDPYWIRSIRDVCIDEGVPFLFKQWGGRTSKAGGRELDGRTWDEYPQVAS